MDKKYSVSLLYDEIILLDGKASPEIQKKIEEAKAERGFGLDDFSNEVLRKALVAGKLTWGYTKISQCLYCAGKPRGYEKYTRYSRNHRKGENNYDRPHSYGGVEPMQGFVSFTGMSGICSECWNKTYLPKIVNYIIEHDLPIEIQKNDIAKTKYKKDPIRICYACGKEMRESEMGKSRTLMGDGFYASKCPYCKTESTIFGTSHKTTDKFAMVKMEDAEATI